MDVCDDNQYPEYNPPSPTPPYVEKTDSQGNPPSKEPEVTGYSAVEPNFGESGDDSSEDGNESSDSSVVELPVIKVSDDDWDVASKPKTQAQIEEETRAWAEICKKVRQRKMVEYAKRKRDI